MKSIVKRIQGNRILLNKVILTQTLLNLLKIINLEELIKNTRKDKEVHFQLGRLR